MKNPNQRHKDPRYRPTRPKRKPKPDPFQFKDLQDVPSGVTLSEERHLTSVNIPTRQWGIGLAMTAASVAVGILIGSQLSGETTPPFSFLLFLSLVSGVLLVLGLFHLFGNIRVDIEDGHMYHFRGLFGIGMKRSMPLSSIKGIGTKRKTIAMRAAMGMAGNVNISDGQSGNLYLFIDGEQYVESCKGARNEHIYYLKYFIGHFVRKWKNKDQERLNA